MFTGFSKRTFDFFFDLQLHNNKPWFQEHKQEFEEHLNRPFRMLANDTLPELLTASYSQLTPLFDFMLDAYHVAEKARTESE